MKGKALTVTQPTDEFAAPKWVEFDVVGTSPSSKTLRIVVRSKQNGSMLGIIQWHSAWRRYTFQPTNAIFEWDCLRDIADETENLTRRHRLKTALEPPLKGVR